MKLLLLGSGEYTDSVDDIDDYIIRTLQPRKIAAIPLAAGKERDVHKWLDRAVTHYKRHSVQVEKVPIINANDANNEELLKIVNDADWIYFSGGDPRYLYDCLESSELLKMMRHNLEKGVLLAGSSAGAMALGEYIPAISLRTLRGPEDEKWRRATGIFPYTIFPHFDRMPARIPFFTRMLKSFQTEHNWIGIDENTAIFVDGKEMLVLGKQKVQVHKAGDDRAYFPGQRIEV